MRAGRIEAAAERVGPCRPLRIGTPGDVHVRDPDANERHDIETISRTELATPAAGFWVIERR